MELDKAIDEYLNNKESLPKERDYFYVSEIGKSKKELYESLKTPKSKKFEARVKRILDNGDSMHARYFKYFMEMKILIAAEIKAVDTELIHGRADAIVTDGKDLWVVDLKSCSQWVFQKLIKPSPEHELQLQFYMYYLNIPRGTLLYEDKNTQAVKVFNLTLNRELVLRYIDELTVLKEQIKNNVIPEDKPITLEDLQYEN